MFGAMTRKQEIKADVNGLKLTVVRDEEGVYIDGQRIAVESRGTIRQHSGCDPSGHPVPIYVLEDGDVEESHRYTVYIAGEALQVEIVTSHDERLRALRQNTVSSGSRPEVVRAPMPGLLKAHLVKVGDIVERGDSVCILEAMKMENELKSPDRLRVRRIVVDSGAAVEKGVPLMELEPLDSTSDSSTVIHT